MPPSGNVIIRPRSVGEILDDAWRLYLADAPLLLALSSLFTVPAAVALLLLLTQPRPEALLWRLVLPTVTAALLPLTGLGSGACQEVFRRRAEGEEPGLFGCLGAALWHGLSHITARAVVLVAALVASSFGILCFVLFRDSTLWLAGLTFAVLALPSVAALAGTSAVHPIVAANEASLFGALGASSRDASRHPAKAFAVTFTRFPVLVLVTLNLFVLVQQGLWVAETLGGVETAYLNVLLSETNPAYLTALLLLSGILVSPFVEASNFLLHADARARYEGLDLWYRVQHLFPAVERARAVALLLAVGVGMGLLPTAGWAAPPNRHRAAERQEHLATVRKARQEVEAIRAEVEQAKPYPGSEHWLPRLRAVARSLDPQGNATVGPYRWFYQGLDGFDQRSQEGAVRVLADLDQRLTADEEALALVNAEPDQPEDARPRLSREEIKSGLTPQPEAPQAEKPDRPKPKPPEAQPEERRRPRHDDEGGEGGQAHEPDQGGTPVPSVGLGSSGWIILGGLLLAVLLVSVVLLWQHRPEPKTKPVTMGKSPAAAQNQAPAEPQNPATLWRQADDLARKGQFLEALRAVYLGVLFLLHKSNLIRYEVTRTNGEYTTQLRLNPNAPAEMQGPFQQLTRLFEVKWYGERTCRPDEYQTCRELAEEIRSQV